MTTAAKQLAGKAYDKLIAVLEFYLNRYSLKWNQDCDICWATYIAFVHFLYGAFSWQGAVIVFFITQVLKTLLPTDHDRGLQ